MDENNSRSEDDTGEEPEDSNSSSALPNLPSSSRQMRNQAEKQRRDKLTGFINELGRLVPMVAGTAKRLDKTSILRLSATFLRMHQVLINGSENLKVIPNLPRAMNWCHYMLEGMDGMLLVVTASGKIVFISHSVESLLGHQQIELLGQSLFTITNIEDHDELRINLRPDDETDQGEEGPSRGRRRRTGEGLRPQRRSFYVRLRQRAASRSDQPQYELVHILGHLRVPPPPPDRKHRTEPQINSDVVLVALVKPSREKHISEYSLLEATKEEWITRHLVDGRIVFTDHRISVASGYLSEEVTGIHAFQYMHKDDVRWVMIALRQMYFRNESYGCSCYRLQTKTGDFIYVRTYGYLELAEDANSIQSFICINSLVSKEEGERYISEMKAKFTPLVVQKTDPGVSALAENHIHLEEVELCLEEEPSTLPTVSDPDDLYEAIEQLMTDIPGKFFRQEGANTLPNQQYERAKMVAKMMPPISIHSSKVGVPIRPLRRNSTANNYGRPSVLRVTQSDNVSVVEPVESGKQMSVVVVKTEKGKRTVEETEPIVKRLKPEETSVIVSEPKGQGVIRNRHDFESELKVDVMKEPLLDTLNIVETFSFSPGNVFLETNSETTPFDSSAYLNDLPVSTATDALEDPQYSPINHWSGVQSTLLQDQCDRDHKHLEDSMQFQEGQFREIASNLTSVSFEAVGSQIYRNTYTTLKAEHRKQQQMLRTLKQDHQNMQHCKDHLNMRGAHQDIGV